MPTVDDARALVARIGEGCGVYKIGVELIYAGGIELARELVAAGKRVFIDAKLLDIDNTVERATASIARLGATFLTVHGTDRRTLEAALRGRGEAPLRLLAVTVLTSLRPEDLREQGIGQAPEALVLRRAALAQAAGFDGVVASGREARALRARFPDLVLVTPGIRPAGTEIGDQSRATTPASAIAAGSDYLVVGRPITRAADPRAAALAIVDEIAAAQGG